MHRLKQCVVAATAAFIIVAFSVSGAGASTSGWAIGSDAYVSNPAGTSDLDLHAEGAINASSNGDTNFNAAGDFNVVAGNHPRFVSGSGAFEFENRSGAFSRLLAYKADPGTALTPIRIGGDSQDVVSLQVDSGSSTADIAQFMKAGVTKTAIDAQARLRMNGVTLEPQIVSGNLDLVATLPDGTKRYLRFSRNP